MADTYGMVYLITNKVNGKVYVGQTTKTLAQRWSALLLAAGRKGAAIRWGHDPDPPKPEDDDGK